MADLTIDIIRLVRATESEIFTAPAGEDVDYDTPYLRLDDTTGYLVPADATTPADAGDFGGILIDPTDEHMTATIATEGALLDLGDALDGLDFGDSVFLGDSGALSDDAGTEVKVVGQVVVGFASTGGDRLLRVVNRGVTTPPEIGGGG